MAAGEADEAVTKQHARCIATYCPSNQLWRAIESLTQPADNVFGNIRQVRVTSAKHVWPGLSKEHFHPFRRSISASVCNSKAHPARIPLPQFPSPYQGAGCPRSSSSTRYEEQAEKRNQNERCEERDQDKHLDGDSFLDCKWI